LIWLLWRLIGGGPASSEPENEGVDVLIAEGRLLERRSVTDEGTEDRGELFGVLCGGGSFDRALWTRSSIFCIRLRRLFIW
jgi:hypothetical protein